MSPTTHVLNLFLPLLFSFAIMFLQWWRWRDARTRGMTADQFELAASTEAKRLQRQADSPRVTAWLLIFLPILAMALPLIR